MITPRSTRGRCCGVVDTAEESCDAGPNSQTGSHSEDHADGVKDEGHWVVIGIRCVTSTNGRVVGRDLAQTCAWGTACRAGCALAEIIVARKRSLLSLAMGSVVVIL